MKGHVFFKGEMLKKIPAPIAQCQPPMSIGHSSLVKMDGHAFFQEETIVKIHLRRLRIIFSNTKWPILTTLGTKYPLRDGYSSFVKRRVIHFSKREIIAKIYPRVLKTETYILRNPHYRRRICLTSISYHYLLYRHRLFQALNYIKQKSFKKVSICHHQAGWILKK